MNEPANKAYGQDSEEREEEFPSVKFPTEGHAVVLDENELKPRGDFNSFSQIHSRLDADLDDLVCDKYGDEKYGG